MFIFHPIHWQMLRLTPLPRSFFQKPHFLKSHPLSDPLSQTSHSFKLSSTFSKLPMDFDILPSSYEVLWKELNSFFDQCGLSPPDSPIFCFVQNCIWESSDLPLRTQQSIRVRLQWKGLGSDATVTVQLVGQVKMVEAKQLYPSGFKWVRHSLRKGSLCPHLNTTVTSLTFMRYSTWYFNLVLRTEEPGAGEQRIVCLALGSAIKAPMVCACSSLLCNTVSWAFSHNHTLWLLQRIVR